MVEQAQSDSERHGSRLEFETLISDLSSRFINVPAGEVDREITDALRRVSESLGIDFAVLWQWSGGDSKIILPTHVYHAQEGLQPPEPLSQEMFPWFVQQMLAGRMVVLSSLDEIPPAAAGERAPTTSSSILRRKRRTRRMRFRSRNSSERRCDSYIWRRHSSRL